MKTLELTRLNWKAFTVLVMLGLPAWYATVVQAYQDDDERPKIRGVDEIEGLPKRIAFGSCANQNKPQPVLTTVLEKSPDLFIYLGDNIYGDTRDMRVLRDKYDQLGAKPEFQSLRKDICVLSIWDDHDYGENDAGKEYPRKEESREIFFDFWAVPEDSPRRDHPGIYGAHRFESGGKVLQVILLDTRTFRDPLLRIPRDLPEDSPWKNAYQPDDSTEKTLLGDRQWLWLEERLRKPADVRIIATSIQFGHEYNGWESWTNLPREQQRMVDTIKKTRANGVVFISGDVHWGEISRRDFEDTYPLYDVTASGITEDWHNVEPNKYRVGEVYRENHFGQIDIDWDAGQLKLMIIDRDGTIRTSHQVDLEDLAFK